VTLTLSAESSCDVYAGLTATATIGCNVGAPYSLELTLAADRWISTYPS
jgi:hypothetical protein